METKICTKCGLGKPIFEFDNKKSSKDGLRNECKRCRQVHFQMVKGLNQEQAMKYIADKENETQLLKSGYKLCPECKIVKPVCDFTKDEKRKGGIDYWCKKCTSKYSLKRFHSEKGKEYTRKNADKISKRNREHGFKYRELNRKRIREQKKQYYESYYKVARRRKIAIYTKERRNNDLAYRIGHNMSYAIWRSLKGNKNGLQWENLIGYSLNDLKQHLEKQFKERMTWENYGRGGWHIDHKIPISIFNIIDLNCKGFKKCWALENLQPMWEKENIIKNNKLFAA